MRETAIMRRRCGLLWALPVLLTAAQLAPAAETQWLSQSGPGELTFSAWYEGEELPGRFADFAARAARDETGTPTALTVEVNLSSADMNDREVNEELAEPEWFDTASFPVAEFTSREVRKTESGYVAVGKLRLKGVERALEIPLVWQPEADGVALSGAVTISRRDWRIGTGDWDSDARLAERVELHYDVRLAPDP